MRAVLAAGILATAAIAPAGCYSCAAPEALLPSVYVDASAWFDAHDAPASVTACIVTTCENVARAARATQIEVPPDDRDGPIDVGVTLTIGGRTSTERLTVTLGVTGTKGPCGGISNRGRVVEVGPDGALVAGGVLPDTTALQTRRASTTSSPTPSPAG